MKGSEEKLNLEVRSSLLCISQPCYELLSNKVMSIIFLLTTLQLPKYVVDLTIKSDEKDSNKRLNLEVRVCCLFLRPVLIELFSNKVKLTFFFHSLQLPDYVVDLTINR